MGAIAETASFTDQATVTGPACDRPVDLVHLSRYTLGNRSLEREVLQLFLTQSQIYLDRLKGADDEKAWHDAAHTIKGSARGIGAWHLVTSAEAAETLSGQKWESNRAEAATALAEDVAAVNEFIRSVLADI